METEAIQITVFDLVEEDCVHTAEELRTYCMCQGLPAKVEQFTKIQPFVLDFKSRCDVGRCYDMAFVGVDDIMGVEAARHVRGMDDLFPLFFISRQGNDYAMEAYRLMTLHYLIKPVLAQALEDCISRITSNQYSGRRPPLLWGGQSEWLDNLHPSPYKRRREE